MHLTSNRPDYIDPAILRPERIDRKVKVGRPDRRASRDIFRIYLNPSVPIDPKAVEEHGGPEAAREALVDAANNFLFRRSEETEFLEVRPAGASGQGRRAYYLRRDRLAAYVEEARGSPV